MKDNIKSSIVNQHEHPILNYCKETSQQNIEKRLYDVEFKVSDIQEHVNTAPFENHSKFYVKQSRDLNLQTQN